MYKVAVFSKLNDIENFNVDSQIVPLMCFRGRFSLNAVPYRIFYSNRKVKISNFDDSLDVNEPFVGIDIQSIVRVEQREREVLVYTSKENYWETDVSLQHFYQILNPNEFIRTHANHLVNVKSLKSFIKCNAFITLNNSDAIPVSPEMEQEILKCFEDKNQE